MDLQAYLDNIIYEFQKLKTAAEKAMVQIDDEQFFKLIDPEANSVAILVKHLCGNLRSRWRDFLTSDGEKPDRNRDYEFIITDEDTREQLMNRWESCWGILFETLSRLIPADLDREITIRAKKGKVYSAINRQLTHYSVHVGQILMLCKHYKQVDWETLSIARGRSDEHNEIARTSPDDRKYFK